MGGGILQLAAFGAQDLYLTGNPQITYFKTVYRRHTNFATEFIKQGAIGDAHISDSENLAQFIISRNGDLIYKMFIEVTRNRSELVSIKNPGAAMIKEASIEIGGQLIDRHFSQWLEIFAELTEPNPSGLEKTNPDDGTLFQKMSHMGGVSGEQYSKDNIFVPLQFWFNRNPGVALPLIALQYHEVKIILRINSIANCEIANAGSYTELTLWVDYIFLDTDERRRFTEMSHEYLIEQLQVNEISPKSKTLNLNHPVKELIWVGKPDATNPTKFKDPLGTNWKLILNGQDRFAERPLIYFTRTQVWQHHTGHGGIGENKDRIAVYSFALEPELHQPSGTCNFSRIDNAELVSSTTSEHCTVYAVNYNILRIMSGMGGLAYSN
jgi:hypothetical protein